jgi:hypothetical protein
VFVAGGELSLFGAGFVPGQSFADRIPNLGKADLRAVCARLSDYLGEVAAEVRGRFGGKISYAAGPWEEIDWAPFDIVSLDGDYVRDEGEQVRYLAELLDVFSAAGVDNAFWFSFAGFGLPRHDDPRRDMDLASYGWWRYWTTMGRAGGRRSPSMPSPPPTARRSERSGDRWRRVTAGTSRKCPTARPRSVCTRGC